MTLVEAWRERLYSSGGRVAIRTGVGTTETEFDRRERLVSTPNTARASGNEWLRYSVGGQWTENY